MLASPSPAGWGDVPVCLWLADLDVPQVQPQPWANCHPKDHFFFPPREMGAWCCSHRAAGALAARAQGKAGSPIAASVVLPPWSPLRAELSTCLCSGSRSRAATRLLPGEEAETALSTGSQTEGVSPRDGPAAFGLPAIECHRKRPASVAPCARPTCLPY